MALNFDYYGKQDGETSAERIAEASEYFAQRLHETIWTAASDADREKALIAARGIIDALNYKGNKASVYTLLQANPHASQDEIRAAEASQPLEFPRGADTEVPDAIRIAEYEIAYALLDGKDPELELENLAVSAMGYGAVKTSYERSQVPIEHIINLVPSSVAWRLLKPFLRDSDALKLSRLS
jgi:Putative DnaT-like ssDNA binding protein